MKKTLAFLMILLGAAACGPRGNKPNVELIQDMMEQEAIKAQRYDPWFKDGISSLVPPSNTEPIGFTTYKFGNDAEAAGRELKNPIANDPSTLIMGQKYFNTNCAACHGFHGHGDGPVSKKYPLKIPALVSDKVRGWPDGHIYHVITMGQGTMGPYASHVPQNVRWQVVNYIRHLQAQEK